MYKSLCSIWFFLFYAVLFQALIDATASESSLEDEAGVRMVALFDHEEVGSNSAQGAGSPVTLNALSRITNSFTSNSQVITAPPFPTSVPKKVSH